MPACGLVRYIAMKDHAVSWAQDAPHFYKRHLSKIYDRMIGTAKGMGRLSVQTKNNKLISPC